MNAAESIWSSKFIKNMTMVVINANVLGIIKHMLMLCDNEVNKRTSGLQLT